MDHLNNHHASPCEMKAMMETIINVAGRNEA